MSLDSKEVMRLYEELKVRLYLLALSIVGNRHDAEEVVHTVFCRLLSVGTTPESPEFYLLRAVRNEAYNERERQNRKRHDVSLNEEAFIINRNSSEGDEQIAQLDRALESISVQEREVIMVHIYGKMKFREIADLFKTPLSTVTSRYQRGLERLKRILEEMDHENG